MKKLLLIDGHNLLFQMFYGMPSRIVNKKGVPIHGILGFLGALRKITQSIDPTHVLVVFDAEVHNERSIIYPDYKSNRIDYSSFDNEDNPFSQLPLIYLVLNHLKIKYYEVKIGEADDLIGTYASDKFFDKVIISSFDSDYFQLIGKNISVLRYRGKSSYICDEKYIEEKYGIKPYQYIDFKSLVGDSADNIKGADKIGIKTASVLLNRFGTLESVLNSLNEIEKESIRLSLSKNEERLRMNYKLIKLKNDVEKPIRNDELLFYKTNFSTVEILKSLDIM